MQQRFAFIDWETFSEIDILKAGGPRYAEDPSTELLMGAWAHGWDGEIKQWVPAEGEPMPNELEDLLLDERVIKKAWNASFEQLIAHYVLGLPWAPEQWYCDMVHAYTLSLPGQLKKVGPIIRLGEQFAKLAEGDKLIKRFCKPQPQNQKVRRWNHRNDPEGWDWFKHYNRQDIVSERAIAYRLRKWPLPHHEWENWVLDQRINQRGLPIDMHLVETCSAMRITEVKRLQAEAKKITGLANPNSDAQLLPWVQGRGYQFDSIDKKAVRRALADHPLVGGAREALELRSEWKKTSTTKYDALLRAANSDGWLRYAFQFAGAQRTWRWAGRNGFQPQNLPSRGLYPDVEDLNQIMRDEPDLISVFWDNPMLALSTLIRTSVRAPEGEEIVVADLNAIENRVLGWVCDEQKILDVFHKGRDPYKDFGTYMFKVPYDEITKQQRTDSKPAVLGAGYMLSGGIEWEDEFGNKNHTGLWGYAEDMGIEMSEEMAHESVRTFRQTYTKVVDFWWEIDRAFRHVILTGETVKVGKFLTIDRRDPFLRIGLPSGRHLHYLRPKIELKPAPWDKTQLKETITYEGVNQKNKQWTRISTHPGKIVENVVQAIARDVLMHGIRVAVERYGLNVIGHVHDEILVLIKKALAAQGLADLCAAMGDVPHWAPGLPLRAEGFITKFYRKDD